MPEAPVTQYAPPPQPAPVKASNGLATAGFVVGLIGFLGSFIPVLNIVGIVLGVVGVILAAVGLSKSKKSGSGKGLAISGLVLGALAVVIGIVINVAFVNAVDSAIDEVTETTVEVGTDGAGDDGDDEARDTDAGGDTAGADNAVGSTRDNPAPLGSAITGGDWTVTVNSVTTTESDSLGQGPADGSVLLLVNVTATYNGTDSQGSTPWASVNFVTAEGTTVDSLDASSLFVPENGFDSLTTLYEGGSVTGDQIIEVPADGWENGVLAVSPDLMSDDTFVALS